MASKKFVLFGAGKIGRSFIGQLFSRSGYEVVFIDIDERIISALNQHRKYRVIIKSDAGDEVIWVENVRGILSDHSEDVMREIAESDIMAISVGQKAIQAICPIIAKGIELRFEKFPDYPIDIILAENLRDAAKVAANEINKYLPESIDLYQYAGLIETSIGKMVPIMPEIEGDPLLVYAEPYNTLILDAHGFKNPIPVVEGLAPKGNMPAWVDRKSFIHNLGHAAAAYYGNAKYPELNYLYEIMAKQDVCEIARSAMLQSADILMKQHPGEFTKRDLVVHIDDLLLRFSNRALRDTVFRVGQDLYRKLGPEDRLVGALKVALKYRMPYDKILHIIACALHFDATDERGSRSQNDVKFCQNAELGISHILEHICGVSKKEFPHIHEEANKIII